MKISLIVLTIALLLFFGGGYWYFIIYEPAQYAKAVLALEDELKSYGERAGQPQFRWRYDYETAINALDRHEAFFSQWFKKIQDLRPPLFNQEMKKLHENLVSIGTEFPKGIDRAKKHIAFARNAIGLFRNYRPESSTIRETIQPELRPPQSFLPSALPYDLGTAADAWRSQLAASKSYADAMFNQEVDIGGDTFNELKSLWGEINTAAETVLPALEQKFGRKMPLRSLPRPSELEKTIPGATSLDKIDEFLNKLEAVIIRSSAEQILMSSFNPIRSEDLQRRWNDAEQFLKKLRGQ